MSEVRLPAPVIGKRAMNLREDGADAPGTFAYGVSYSDSDRKVGLFYRCPCGCGTEHYIGFKPPSEDDVKYARDTWAWDGNIEAPTVSPSIHSHDWVEGIPVAQMPTHWHGWLQGGVFKQA